MQNDAEEGGNYVACIIACIIKSIIQCIGDILEWISTYVYVQCAVRGLGFLDGARATYALATIGNLIYIVAAILCEWVVFMGACLCAMTGAIVAGFVGYYTSGLEGGWAVIIAVIAAFFWL